MPKIDPNAPYFPIVTASELEEREMSYKAEIRIVEYDEHYNEIGNHWKALDGDYDSADTAKVAAEKAYREVENVSMAGVSKDGILIHRYSGSARTGHCKWSEI